MPAMNENANKWNQVVDALDRLEQMFHDHRMLSCSAACLSLIVSILEHLDDADMVRMAEHYGVSVDE